MKTKGSSLAGEFLLRQEVEPGKVDHIQSIIKHVSYKGGFPRIKSQALNFRLFRMPTGSMPWGPSGLPGPLITGDLRTGPSMIRQMPLQEYDDPKSYHTSDAPTINHFYEKLLKLKGSDEYRHRKSYGS